MTTCYCELALVLAPMSEKQTEVHINTTMRNFVHPQDKVLNTTNTTIKTVFAPASLFLPRKGGGIDINNSKRLYRSPDPQWVICSFFFFDSHHV